MRIALLMSGYILFLTRIRLAKNMGHKMQPYIQLMLRGYRAIYGPLRYTLRADAQQFRNSCFSSKVREQIIDCNHDSSKACLYHKIKHCYTN